MNMLYKNKMFFSFRFEKKTRKIYHIKGMALRVVVISVKRFEIK